MAVFHIEKTRDYTVMSYHHLRDAELPLKAKGLLPSARKGRTASALRSRNWSGQVISSATGFGITPDSARPKEVSPDTVYPDTENPDMDNPGLENQPQLNIDKSSNYPLKKDLSNTDKSNPILSNPPTPNGEQIGDRKSVV